MPTLPVADLARAIEFYEASLGFRLHFRNGDTFAIVARDSVELGLILAGFAAIPLKSGRCYCKLASGIDGLYHDYQARGVTILHELRDEPYAMREFMIADLDRNEINFGEAMR